jgi:hypothetical protein
MPFQPVKFLLVAALGASLAFAAQSHAMVASIGLIALASASFLFWLLRHTQEVKAAYAARREKGRQYIASSARPWKKPPNNLVQVLLPLAVGSLLVYAAFADAQAPTRSYLKQVAYSAIGPAATLVLAALAGAYFLCLAVESALGAYLAREA